MPAFILLSILFPFEDLSITGCGTGSLAEVPQNPFYLQTSYLSGTLLLNEPSPINGLFDIDLWFLEVIGLMGLCGFWLHFICNWYLLLGWYVRIHFISSLHFLFKRYLFISCLEILLSLYMRLLINNNLLQHFQIYFRITCWISAFLFLHVF